MAKRTGRLVLVVTLALVGVALLVDEATRGPEGVRSALPATTVESLGADGVTAREGGRTHRDGGSGSDSVSRGKRPDPPSERTVTVTLGGAHDEWSTSEARVGDVLDELGIELGPKDDVTPDLGAPVLNGIEIVIRRVDIVEEVERHDLPADVVKRETDERIEGDREVVRDGRDGWREIVEEVRLVDGFETERVVVADEVTDPVDEVVEVGTAPQPPAEPEPASGSASGSSSPAEGTDDVWDRLAQCESNGDWSAATGNGYYGGLQFHPDTWANHGGHEYASSAHQATRAQQIAVAERVRASQGWAAWPSCSRQLGLR